MVVRRALRLTHCAALALAVVAMSRIGTPVLAVLIGDIVLVHRGAHLADRACTAFAVAAVLTNTAPVLTCLEWRVALYTGRAGLAQ